MRSVTHSTGAWSSVQGSSAGATGPRRPARSMRTSGARRGDGAGRRRGRRGQPEHDAVEAQRLPPAHLRELVRQRALEPAREPVVARHRGHVQRDEPARAQALADEAEELARGQVEGHVGLVVRVDVDEVEALVRAAQERARVGVGGLEPRVVAHAEVAVAGVRHRGVDLDALDADARVEDAEGACHGAACVAEHGEALRRVLEQRGHGEERVPHAAGQHRVRPPERVHGDALVQVHAPRAVDLPYLDELVRRLVLVDHALGRLDRAGRDREQRRRRDQGDEPAPAEERHGARREHGGREQHRALRADQRDEDERRQERPQQAAGRGERVQAPGDRARLADVDEGESHRERRDRARAAPRAARRGAAWRRRSR